MLPKIKRFVRNNKKQVKTGLLVLLVIIILLVLYKSLFYSSSEKSVYGVRIRDINIKYLVYYIYAETKLIYLNNTFIMFSYSSLKITFVLSLKSL